MDIFHALLLGIIEGVTEFLPISSTGHLILASHFLNIPESSFLKSFEIIIQLGAICAVLVLYGKSLLTDRALFMRTIVAFIPTGIIGFIIYTFAKTYLLGNVLLVFWALFIGGILILLFESWYEKREHITVYDLATMPYTHAILIGVFQSVAIIPGVSRAAATIFGGVLLGLPRAEIVRFSFLLAIPTMAAASAYDLYKNASVFSQTDFIMLAVGFIAAFITALFAIRFLLSFIKTHSFKPFAYYRIGLVIFFFLLLHVVF